MATNEAKVKFTADTTAFNSAIKEANSSIKEMQSALKLNATQMSTTSSSTDQLRERLKLLEQEDEALAAKKEALNGKLEEAVKYFGEDSTEAANLRTQLNNLENQSAKVEQEIASTNSEIEKQEEAARQSESALGQLTSTISSQESELSALKTQYTNAVLEFGETSDEAQELAGQITSLNSDLNENKAKLNNAVQATDDLTKSEDDLGDSAEDAGQKGVDSFNEMYDALTSMGLMKAVEKLVDAFKACVSVAADFEEQMSTVKALSGATADEMDTLSAAAKEMGATTAYTATEAAEALEYMALAGWSTEEMTDALAGVINLAAASGMDLAKASDIVTDDLSAFGLSASDANDFVDKLTYAMSSSNTTTEQLGEAYKNCAATSTQLGYDLDETTAALMVMADAGIKGGEAGTALSSIMTRLGNNTSGCRDVLEDFGVEVYNENGQVNDLTSILSGCKDVWAKLTDEEKSNLAYTVAGRTAQSEFMTLMGDSTGNLETYTEGLRNCSGAAQEMADIKLDNFNGQVTLLKSAWDGLMTTMGEETLPVLTNITESLTGMVGWFDNLLQNCPALTDLIIALGIGLGTAAVGMAAMAVATTSFGNALKEVVTNNWVGLLVSAIVALSAALVVFIALQSDNQNAQKQLRKEIKETTKAINEQNEAYEGATAENEEQAKNVQVLVSDLEGLMGVTNKTTAEQEQMKYIVDQLNEALPDLALEYDEEADSINYTTEELEQLVDEQSKSIQYADDVAQMNAMYDLQAQAVDELAAAQENEVKAQAELERQMEIAAETNYTYMDGVNQANAELAKAKENTENAQAALDEATTAYEDAADKVNAYGEAQKAAAEETEGTVEVTEEMMEVMEAAAERVENATDVIVTTISGMNDAYADCLEEAEKSLFGQCDAWDEVALHSEHSVEEVIKGLQSQQAAAENFTANLDALNESNIAGMSEWLASVDDGSDTFVELVDIMANASEEDQARMIEAFAGSDAAVTSSADHYNTIMGHYAEVTQEMVEEVANSIIELDMEDDANQEAYQTLLGYRDGIRAGEIEVDTEAKNMVDRVIAQVEQEMGITGGKSSQFSKLGELTATGYMIGISGSTADVNNTMSSVATGALHAFESTMEVASPSKATERDGEYTMEGFINGVNGKSGESTSALTQCALDALNGFKGVATSTALKSAGSDTIQGFINGADSKSGTMTSKMQSLASSAKSNFTNNATTSTLYSSGQNTIQGYINGIDNKSSTLYKKMTSVANTAISKFNSTLQIASPSKVMTQSGEYTGEGYIIGIESEESEVGRAMEHLANAATSSFDESMDPLSVSTNMDYSATMSGAVNQSLFGISQQIMAMADEIASRPVVVQINGKNFATATSGDMDSAMGTRQQLVARGLSL